MRDQRAQRPAVVRAGDYAELRLDFQDDAFFARLFGWQNPAGKASAKPSK